MKKLISLVLIGLFFSGCNIVHKMDIEQGNIITQERVSQLRVGMSEAEVKGIMGNPVTMNIFSPDRMEYIYTLQKGHGKVHEQRAACLFRVNILKEVIES